MATRLTKETLYVRHDFTDAERLSMGDDLAQAHNRMASIEEEEAVMKAQIKDRKAGVEASIGALYRNLNNRFEMRNIACELTYDVPNVGEVTYTGPDGVIVKTRAMTSGERQMDLPLTDREGEIEVIPPAAVEASAEKSAENIAGFFESATGIPATKSDVLEAGRQLAEMNSNQPSAADLDAVAEEADAKEQTAAPATEPFVATEGDLWTEPAAVAANAPAEPLHPADAVISPAAAKKQAAARKPKGFDGPATNW